MASILLSWFAVALVLLIIAAFLIIRGSTNPRQIKKQLESILHNPDKNTATRQLHNLMSREKFRKPYKNVSPEYIAWVQRNSAVKDQGRVVVGVLLLIGGIYCLAHSFGLF